jgi:hypothetical protein
MKEGDRFLGELIVRARAKRLALLLSLPVYAPDWLTWFEFGELNSN